MGSGLKHENQLDPLTAWELAAINLLIALYSEDNLDVKASRANMLALIQALDRGDLDPALRDTSARMPSGCGSACISLQGEY